MSTNGRSRIPDILRDHQAELLSAWTEEQLGFSARRLDGAARRELQDQCRRCLGLMSDAAAQDSLTEPSGPGWAPVRDLLATISHSRARQGFTPSETVLFVLSLRKPLFARLRREYGSDAEALADETETVITLFDALGLYTAEVYQKSRDEVIRRQQEELMELSTPVVRLWDGVLALPLIGALDSARTQVVMENLLEKLVETAAGIAIIDITGVPTVDTQVAQHLLKTIAAARLMGAECIISGIRPQIAQTIVHLGVDLGDVITKATLADAFAVALKRNGLTVTPAAARA